MEFQEKLVLDIIALTLFVIVMLVMVKYMKHTVGTQMESEQDANLKRLFGNAWKKAKDL